jgi:hypothetical protein
MDEVPTRCSSSGATKRRTKPYRDRPFFYSRERHKGSGFYEREVDD